MKKRCIFLLLTTSLCLLAACGKQSQNKAREVVMRSDYEVESKVIEIPNGENTIYGTFYYPKTEEKAPLIIMCHGYNGIGDDFRAEGERFAQNGIATYTLDFCGGSVRSRSTGDTKDMTIFSEKSDLLSAYQYFKAQDSIDTNNIFLFGGSQGGLVTALATEELGDEVAGMALYYPALCIPDNWRETYPETAMIPESNEFWGMTLGYDFFASIHDFDVFDAIGKYKNNVLIIHGDEDAIVPLSYSEKASKLYQNAELIVLEHEGHGFQSEAGKVACEDVLEFMKNNIR